MTKFMMRATSSLLGVFLAIGFAQAGVVMQYETTGASGKAVTGNLQIGADRIRTDHGDVSVIFRGDQQLMWILEPKQGRYMEMTKDQMQQMGAQISGAMAQMQEQLKNMPADQRAMVEQMMKSKMPMEAPKIPTEPPTFVKNGKSETINGFPCVAYDAMMGDKKHQELWVTSWKQVGLTAKDFAVLQQLAAFVKDAVGPMAQKLAIGLEQSYSDVESPNALPGVPIRVVTFSDHGDAVMEIKKIARQEIPAAQFEVPAGLKKEAMGGDAMKMKLPTRSADTDGQ